MRVLLALTTVLLAACPPRDGAGPSAGGGAGGPVVDNTGGGPPPAPGVCQIDADCVISAARPDECCDQLCEPWEQAWHRDLLAEHEAWKGMSCGEATCPVARCAAPNDQTIAVCRDGACVVERQPRPAP